MYRSTESWLASEEALWNAILHFCPGGLGLELCQPDSCQVEFSGGGGHVTIVVGEKKGATWVDLETRERDSHVPQFVRELARMRQPQDLYAVFSPNHGLNCFQQRAMLH